MENNTSKDEEGIKNPDNPENNEQKEEKPESLARFDSVDEFKDFLNQSKENIVVSENQIKQRQKQKETNEKNAGMGTKQTKEYNDKIDIDIQKFQDKTLGLQKGLDEYDAAFAILRRIDIAQNQKDTNEKNAGMGTKQTKGFNDKIDVTIAELNKELEEMVVNKEEKKEEEKKEEEKKEESRDTVVSKEREKSLDEELIEEIKAALESKDPGEIGDITRKIYKMEKGEDADLLDFRNLPEMEKYLQEKLEEFQRKLKKEELSESVSISKTEKTKDTKEISPEEKAKQEKEHKKAMDDKELLYKTKIDLREDISEEEKKKLKEKAKFVNKENIKETCEAEIKNLMTLSYNKEDKVKNEEYKAKIDILSEQMGLPQEEVQKIIDTQKTKLEELVYQNKKNKKLSKESKWKKWGKVLGKIALYGVGGVALGALTGGIGAGIGIGVGRIVETLFHGKKERMAREEAAAEAKYMLSGEMSKADMTDMPEEDKTETNNLLNNFYDDISVRLSIEKQNQIEGESKKHSAIGQRINELEKDYDPKDPESKKKLEELYIERREANKKQIKKYLGEQNIQGPELEKRIKLSEQLLTLEDNQKVMELSFVKRKAGLAGKILSKLDSFLSSPAILGGARTGDNQTREKLVTAGIFAIAGTLARSCPIVRNILMAYAGIKLGSAAADMVIGKSKAFKELKQISAETLNVDNSEEIVRAKAQLADPKFKEANPIEHAKLQDKIFAIDRAKLDKFLGNEKQQEEGYVEKTNKALEESVKKRISAQKRSKVLKYGFGIAGGAAGYFISDFIGDKMREKKEKMAADEESKVVEGKSGSEDPKVEGKPIDLDKEIEQKEIELLEKQKELARISSVTVRKGDTVWELTEEQLKERMKENWDELSREEQDYLIDFYKDKVVSTPDLIGIDGDNASALKIGDKLNFAKLFEDTEEMNQVLGEANDLSPEDISNIANNREIIGNVMKDIDNAPTNQLIKAVNIMGGGEESGAGTFNALRERLNVFGIDDSKMEVILKNPDVFGSVVDKEIGNVGNKNLVEAARLLSGGDEVGPAFIKKVAETSPLLGEEIQKRATELGANIKTARDAITELSGGGLSQATDTCNTACGELESLTKLKDATGLGGLIRRFFHSGNIDEQIVSQKGVLEQSFSDIENQSHVLNSMVTEHAGMMNGWGELTNSAENALVDSEMNAMIETQQKVIDQALEEAKRFIPKQSITRAV